MNQLETPARRELTSPRSPVMTLAAPERSVLDFDFHTRFVGRRSIKELTAENFVTNIDGTLVANFKPYLSIASSIRENCNVEFVFYKFRRRTARRNGLREPLWNDAI